MSTVTRVVEKLVREKQFIHEGLRRGIISHAGLAEEILPHVEEVLQKKVTFSAVNMAIRRCAEKLPDLRIERTIFDEHSDVTVRSNLTEIVLFKTLDVQEKLRQLYDVVDLKGGDFLTVTQGLHEVLVITNARHAEGMVRLFPPEVVRKTIPDLASITVHISPDATGVVGMFYLITRELGWESINIIDIVSTYTELTVLLSEKDTGRAFDVMKRLIDGRK